MAHVFRYDARRLGLLSALRPFVLTDGYCGWLVRTAYRCQTQQTAYWALTPVYH